jgi:hypothetical protein
MIIFLINFLYLFIHLKITKNIDIFLKKNNKIIFEYTVIIN